jgi:hypothetical protein
MSSALIILISLLVALQCDFISACSVVPWNTAQSNWQQKCKTDFKGWPDGQRCFFVPDAATTWDASWKACSDKGGKLASILTTSEMNTVRGNFSAIGNLYIGATKPNMSNVEPAYYSTTGCSYARSTTNYYANGNTSSSDKLSVTNTFLRIRQCPGQDDTGGDGQYIILGGYMTQFHDVPASWSVRPLCVASSPVQAFRRVPNTCVTETPLASYDVGDDGLEKCMDSCRRYGELAGHGMDWCRSFNLKGNKCELFTWWFEDHPNMEFRKDCEQDCVHYTYLTTIQ